MKLIFYEFEFGKLFLILLCCLWEMVFQRYFLGMIVIVDWYFVDKCEEFVVEDILMGIFVSGYG